MKGHKDVEASQRCGCVTVNVTEVSQMLQKLSQSHKEGPGKKVLRNVTQRVLSESYDRENLGLQWDKVGLK